MIDAKTIEREFDPMCFDLGRGVRGITVSDVDLSGYTPYEINGHRDFYLFGAYVWRGFVRSEGDRFYIVAIEEPLPRRKPYRKPGTIRRLILKTEDRIKRAWRGTIDWFQCQVLWAAWRARGIDRITPGQAK